MALKRVLVVCSASIVTGTIVAEKLRQLFKDHNVRATVTADLAKDVAALAQEADLIVSTTFLSADYGIPTINGVPFLTGVGTEEALRQIIQAIQDSTEKGQRIERM